MSETSRSTRPGSTTSPACRAGRSIAARRAVVVERPEEVEATLDQPGEDRDTPTGRRGGRPGAPTRPARARRERSARRRKRAGRPRRAVAKASSHWSTTRTPAGSAGRHRSRARRDPSRGSRPTTGVPDACTLAATPARTSDDLPLPDGPTTARTPRSERMPRQAERSSSRPSKPSASVTSYAARPGHGQLSWSARDASTKRSGSWRRIPRSRSASAALGSTASSSTRRVRSARNVARASALVTRSVLRQGQEGVAVLAQRPGGHQGQRIRHDVVVMAGAQQCLDPGFLGAEPELGQPLGLAAPRSPTTRGRRTALRRNTPAPRRARTPPARARSRPSSLARAPRAPRSGRRRSPCCPGPAGTRGRPSRSSPRRAAAAAARHTRAAPWRPTPAGTLPRERRRAGRG